MLGSIAVTLVVGDVLGVVGWVPTEAMSLGGLGPDGGMGIVHARWVAASGAVWAPLASVSGASGVVWAFSAGFWRLPRWHGRRSLGRRRRVRWPSFRRLWLR